jgi:hypothetical protein
MDEVWKTIPEAPDYSISSIGRVRRDNPDWQGKYAGRVLAPSRHRGGYLAHVLCTAEGKITRKVHRLVCEAFNGPQPADKPHCAHRDGDVGHNTPDNLYWATAKQNMADRERHGRGPKGKKLAPDVVAKMARGDSHWTRQAPERVARGENHWRTGTRLKGAYGEKMPAAKLTEDDILEIRATPRTYGSGRALADRFNVSMGLISAVRNGKAWSHVSSDVK